MLSKLKTIVVLSFCKTQVPSLKKKKSTVSLSKWMAAGLKQCCGSTCRSEAGLNQINYKS